MAEYNRMNPKFIKLIDRLDMYRNVNYGREPYQLSVAEAGLLVEYIQDTKELIDHVYKWAGRPTKDGAKNLRNYAGEIENEYF